MQTVAETRRGRLEELIRRHGSIALLNEALHWPRTDPKITQIRNANLRSGRNKPYQMGDAMARQIEQALGLSRGWMDTAIEAAGDELPAPTIEHIGKKLEQQAKRLDLTPSQVADVFGVKPPSVYDWYKHGRIHKSHYPLLVAKFGQPIEWWLDLQPASEPETAQPTHGLSADALQIAKLFDLIPRKDLIKRAQAQMACAQTIINLLQPMPPEPAHTAQGNKTQSS